MQTHPAPGTVTLVNMLVTGYNDSLALSTAFMQHMVTPDRKDLAIAIAWVPMPTGLQTTVTGTRCAHAPTFAQLFICASACVHDMKAGFTAPRRRRRQLWPL